MNDKVNDESIFLVPEYLTVFRRATAILTSSLELDQALANTISACLPALGDFGFFDVVLDGAVRRTASAHEDPETEAILNQTAWSRQERSDINLCALSTGEMVLHPNTDDAWFANAFGNVPRTLAFQSMLSVPVRSGNELIGSLTLFMGSSGRHHRSSDLMFAAELAGIAAPVVVNARLMASQRKTEAALRLSEERLRLATDVGTIGIWDWDILKNEVTWSDKVYELHGLLHGQFGGRVEDFTSLVHPDDREATWQQIQTVLKGDGDVFTNEFRTLLPNGETRWLSTRGRAIKDVGGKPIRMVGSTIDITSQKFTMAGLSDLNTQLEKKVATATHERDRIWRMSQDILAVATFTGHFTSLSPSFTAALGWSEQEALSMPFIEFIHPDHREQLAQRMGWLKEGKAQENFEVQSLHKNGTYRWLSWTFVPETDRIYGVGRDVTELRRQREQALNASEMRLQLALNVGGMGAWQWDLKSGNIIWWPGMAALHGLPLGFTLKRVEDYLDFIHPDDRASVAESFNSAIKGIQDKGKEYRIIWPDGSVRWIEGKGDLLFDEDGQPHHLAGICVDITRRKHTEDNLRFLAKASQEIAELVEHEETLRRIAQLAVPSFADWCAVDLIDETGELKRVAVSHVDPEKVKFGHALHEKYPPDPSLQTGVWQIIRTGQAELVPEITDEMLTASISDPVYLAIIRELGLKSYIGAPLSAGGKMLGVVTFISAESKRIYGPQDVALAEEIGRRAAVAIENSSLYRTLKEADRRKDEFLAMLAHELRNPLAPISTAAEILKIAGANEKQVRRSSEIITRQVRHMTNLVDDLLDVSRVTRGLIQLDLQDIDLKDVINGAIEQSRALIESRNHQLTLRLPAAAAVIHGDRTRLVQIVVNLLNNAAKYTPQGGEIELKLESQNGSAKICVTDNGSGIAPSLIPLVFDLFTQGERTPDRSQGGLGLGLALVKSLTSLHGGRVTAQSKGIGKGSAFTVVLPVAEAKLERPVHQIDNSFVSLSAAALRVMIVDDNRDAAESLAALLESKGNMVDVYCDAVTALKAATELRYQVCILDIGLPDVDGYELARQLRTRPDYTDALLLALTGYGQTHDRVLSKGAGFDYHFVKPIDVTELDKVLAGVASRSR